MQYFNVLYVFIVLLLFLTACDTDKDIEVIDQTVYQVETMPADYLILSKRVFNHEHSPNILTLNLARPGTDRSSGVNLMDSLVESDATSQQVLSTLQEVTMDNGSEASLVFTPLQLFSSMASTEQAHFQEMLFKISSLYGIDLLRFYTGEQAGIMFGQAGEIESMKVEAKENRGYYLFPTDNGTDHYITGTSAGEDIHDKNGELLDFAETVEAMRTVSDHNAAWQSGIPDWITIHHATINEDNQAEISYSIAEGQESEWSEEEEEQWENILQLTALDFHVEALRLINEAEETITVFPFRSSK